MCFSQSSPQFLVWAQVNTLQHPRAQNVRSHRPHSTEAICKSGVRKFTLLKRAAKVARFDKRCLVPLGLRSPKSLMLKQDKSLVVAGTITFEYFMLIHFLDSEKTRRGNKLGLLPAVHASKQMAITSRTHYGMMCSQLRPLQCGFYTTKPHNSVATTLQCVHSPC
jgi:hypothetical protein